MSRLPCLFLFDIDGTLTKPRQKISETMVEFLTMLMQKVHVGLIGGSDLTKIAEQMSPFSVINQFDYVFSENGLVAFKNGENICKESIADFLSESKLKAFVNFCLKYISDLDIPIKRGTFIEYRTGMINVSPIGRNCSLVERNEFEKFDRLNKIRQTFIEELQNTFQDYNLKYSIGGQISFDVFPEGWDKTFCMKFLKHEHFNSIFFFGDKYYPGGNDFEMINHPDVKGYGVDNPEETMNKVQNILPFLESK